MGANGNRPVILGNFAWLGASTADEQAAAIASSRIWDRSWSGLEAVFYFAATDYGGGTTNNFLFSATSSGSTVADALVAAARSIIADPGIDPGLAQLVCTASGSFLLFCWSVRSVGCALLRTRTVGMHTYRRSSERNSVTYILECMCAISMKMR